MEGAAGAIPAALPGREVVVDTAVSRSTGATAAAAAGHGTDWDVVVILIGHNDGASPGVYQPPYRRMLDQFAAVPAGGGPHPPRGPPVLRRRQRLPPRRGEPSAQRPAVGLERRRQPPGRRHRRRRPPPHGVGRPAHGPPRVRAGAGGRGRVPADHHDRTAHHHPAHHHRGLGPGANPQHRPPGARSHAQHHVDPPSCHHHHPQRGRPGQRRRGRRHRPTTTPRRPPSSGCSSRPAGGDGRDPPSRSSAPDPDRRRHGVRAEGGRAGRWRTGRCPRCRSPVAWGAPACAARRRRAPNPT